MPVEFELRRWLPDDAQSLAENANNIKIYNNLRDALPHPYSLEDARRFIEATLKKGLPATNFAIVVDKKAVGNIGIVVQEDVQRISAEMGYWLGENYWGKGIMPRAIRQMTDYVFANFEVVKIYAMPFDFNTASQKVLQKAGFEREAILKKAAVKNGKIADLHYYSVIKNGNYKCLNFSAEE